MRRGTRVGSVELARIDARLPAYARVATAEQVALAAKLRADLTDGVARGTFPNHHEAALDAAVLEKTLADAVGTSRQDGVAGAPSS